MKPKNNRNLTGKKLNRRSENPGDGTTTLAPTTTTFAPIVQNTIEPYTLTINSGGSADVSGQIHSANPGDDLSGFTINISVDSFESASTAGERSPPEYPSRISSPDGERLPHAPGQGATTRNSQLLQEVATQSWSEREMQYAGRTYS